MNNAHEAASAAIEQVKGGKDNYYLECYQFAVDFIKSRQNKIFINEDIANAYLETDNPVPAEPRVWGSVIRELKKNGFIINKGFTTGKNARGHGHPTNLWESKI